MKWIILPAIALALIIALPLASADCDFQITSKTAKDLLNEVESLNAQLATCPFPLPSPLSLVFSNDLIQVRVTMQDGSIENILYEIKNGKLSSIQRKSIGNPDFIATTGECEADAILLSDDKLGSGAYAYNQNRITLNAVGFLNQFLFLLIKPVAKIGAKKIAKTTDLSCIKQENGALCDHGGQCLSGNCVGTGQGPPWTYRCSCDPFKYATACQPTPESESQKLPDTGRDNGQVCDHGGQCSSGNCVGVGQGPPWTYKCSCDPFKFATACQPKGDEGLPDKGRAAGQVCDHGGQCATGNCIGVGQGPPWTYKCSCDPFKYVGSGC